MKILRFNTSVEDSLAEKLEAAERQTSLKMPQILTLLASRYLDEFMAWHSGTAPTPPALPPQTFTHPEYTEDTLPPITL